MIGTYPELPPDSWFTHAERTALKSFSTNVSIFEKGKDLLKFGASASVGTNWTTVATFAGSEINETYATTNSVDKVSSSQAADTNLTLRVEGHTIDGSGNLTFAEQDVTTDGTNGQTQVTLATPLARVNRSYVKNSGVFNSPQTAPTGNVYFYSGTAAAGVPSTASTCKLILLAGDAQTQKAATSISQSDFWFIAYFSCAIGDATGPTNFAQVRMEMRDVPNGGVWRPLGRTYVLWPDTIGIQRDFRPFQIVPKNHDWRIRAKADGGTCTIFASGGGMLASVL